MRSGICNAAYSFILQIFMRTYCVTGLLQGAKFSEVSKTIVSLSLRPSESTSGSATFQSQEITQAGACSYF